MREQTGLRGHGRFQHGRRGDCPRCLRSFLLEVECSVCSLLTFFGTINTFSIILVSLVDGELRAVAALLQIGVSPRHNLVGLLSDLKRGRRSDGRNSKRDAEYFHFQHGSTFFLIFLLVSINSFSSKNKTESGTEAFLSYDCAR